MKKVKVIGIKWDSDNKKDVAHLPVKMLLNVPDDICDDDSLNEFISDELSNQSGFTHFGWDQHVLVKEDEKMSFTTVAEGLGKIKNEYLNGEVTEGEFADYLVSSYDDYFDKSVDTLIAIRSIQEFREWDYEMEDDAVKCFGGTEALSENGLYGFVFKRDGKSRQLPDGIRIGIQKEDGSVVLDEGITAGFSRVQNVAVSGYYTEDDEEFDNLAAIGVWDEISNDEHIFFWFNSENEIIGTHDNFVITSYLKDGDSEEKRVSATPWFCIVRNTEEKCSLILEDYDTLKKAMEAYSYIKENGYHRVENGNETDDDIVTLEKGTKISMNIEWRTTNSNCLVLNEGIDVPVIVIENDNTKASPIQTAYKISEGKYLKVTILYEDQWESLTKYITQTGCGGKLGKHQEFWCDAENFFENIKEADELIQMIADGFKDTECETLAFCLEL